MLIKFVREGSTVWGVVLKEDLRRGCYHRDELNVFVFSCLLPLIQAQELWNPNTTI